jgi:hypothetical protein
LSETLKIGYFVNISKKYSEILNMSLDTTPKMKANAPNNYTQSEEEIMRIIERGIAIDKEEDKLYEDKSGDELPPNRNRQKKLREKIEEIEQASGKLFKSAAEKIIWQHALGDEKDRRKVKEKLDKAEEELKKGGQDAVSMSDSEARFMKNKKKRKELSIQFTDNGGPRFRDNSC